MFGNYSSCLEITFCQHHSLRITLGLVLSPHPSLLWIHGVEKSAKMSHLNFSLVFSRLWIFTPKTSRSLMIWTRLCSKCCKMRHFARIFHHSVFAYCPTIWRTFWFFSQKRQENLRKSFWGILTKPFLILC